jgi:hypothetical protein
MIMSLETRFTEEEQVLLSSLPAIFGSAMTFAADSGLATIKEMISSSRTMLAGTKKFAANEIISGILPSMQSMQDAMAEAKDLRAKLQAHLAAQNVSNKEQMAKLVIDDAQKINDLLATKSTPDEADQYKNWVLDIAEEVAKSASEGGFLGFGGTQISDGEKALFAEMAATLGSSRALMVS